MQENENLEKLRDMDFERAGEIIAEIRKNATPEVERIINLGLDSLINPQNYEKQIVHTQNLPNFVPATDEIPEFEEKIKISIIIPVYNCEKWIERCFDSIARQNYKKSLIEVIFTDDCSTDNSFMILRKMIENYEKNTPAQERITFKLFRNLQNLKQGQTRNNGLRKASGDYLCFMDDDDELSENSLRSLAYLAQKYEGVDIVQGNCDVISSEDLGNGRLAYVMGDRIFPEYTNDTLWIRQRFPLYFNALDRINWEIWAKLIRKDFITDNNIYQGSFPVMGEDIHFCFLASKKIKSIAFTKAVTYIYRMDHLSVSMRKNKTQKLLSFIKLYNEMLSHIDWELVFIYISHIKNRIDTFGAEVANEVAQTNKRIQKGLDSLFKKEYTHGESNPGCRDENPVS